MMIPIIILVVLGLLAALLYNKGAGNGVIHNVPTDCASCGGSDSKCEQECMMEAATKDIVYFDDEELDAYKDRPSDSYTDEEAAEFEEVMYTMRQEEVKEWCRSLTLRGINLPDQLKDEAFILIGS